MLRDEPIVDYQSGAMAATNAAVDHCCIDVVAAATFDVLTFKTTYNKDRIPRVAGNVAAIGGTAPDTVLVGVTFPATMRIEGVKTYKLAAGTIIAYHFKN